MALISSTLTKQKVVFSEWLYGFIGFFVFDEKAHTSAILRIGLNTYNIRASVDSKKILAEYF